MFIIRPIIFTLGFWLRITNDVWSILLLSHDIFYYIYTCMHPCTHTCITTHTHSTRFTQTTHGHCFFSIGSPFIVEAEDSLMVVARGRCLKAAAIDHDAMFEIDSRLATLHARPRIKITGNNIYVI